MTQRWIEIHPGMGLKCCGCSDIDGWPPAATWVSLIEEWAGDLTRITKIDLALCDRCKEAQ